MSKDNIYSVSNNSEAKDDQLKLDDFAYDLPPELIAKVPADKRDSSRLLYYQRSDKKINHLQFSNIIDILKPDDVLVVNNTRVIPARLIAYKESGAKIELLLIKREAGSAGLWEAMAMPLKKIKEGDILSIQSPNAKHAIKVEKIINSADGQKRLSIDFADNDGKDRTFTILQDVGAAPLPPYIVSARQQEKSAKDQNKKFDTSGHKLDANKDPDLERYQTVYAKESGAVAAPTAGLHFTPELLAQLKAKGINVLEITLHVGPGTFKPITTEIKDHTVEAEWFSISPEICQAINKAKKNSQRIIAVGTTTCRALESAYLDGQLVPKEDYTSLYVKPGYQFKLIDGLVTNFHLSKSSLLLLVSAFIGREELMSVYQEAIKQRYRFYSYGDAMLII